MVRLERSILTLNTIDTAITFIIECAVCLSEESQTGPTIVEMKASSCVAQPQEEMSVVYGVRAV